MDGPLWMLQFICVLGLGTIVYSVEAEIYLLVTARSSGFLKAKQKLGVTFNSDKLGGIDFTKFSKLSMCSAGAGRCWPVLAGAGWYNGLGFLLGTAHGQF